MTHPAALMVDLSSNNDTSPDLAAYRRSGRRWIGVKATEGNGYVNPSYAHIVDTAHRVGLRVVHYHFGTAGVGGLTQAVHFLKTVTPHVRRGDAVAYDCESQPPAYRQWRTGEPSVVARTFTAFIDMHGPRVGRGVGKARRRGYARLVYGTPGFLNDCRVRLARGWRLWAATYATTAPRPATGWRRWTIWQFTDRGTAPGIAGSVDVSVIRRPLLDIRTAVRHPHHAWHFPGKWGRVHRPRKAS